MWQLTELITGLPGLPCIYMLGWIYNLGVQGYILVIWFSFWNLSVRLLTVSLFAAVWSFDSLQQCSLLFVFQIFYVIGTPMVTITAPTL